MTNVSKLIAGAPFPALELPTPDGKGVDLAGPGWRALFVYRGAHCQICKAFLGQLEERRAGWEAKGIDVVVACADPVDRVAAFVAEAGYRGRAAGGLDEAAMRALGLWMTGPDQSSLDYVHPEPGFFLIDPDGNVAAAEASTLPFVRPDLDWLDRGLAFITENDVRPPFGRHRVAA